MNAAAVKSMIGQNVVIHTTTVTVTGELISVRAWTKDNTVAGIVYASSTTQNAVGKPAQFKISGSSISSIEVLA